MGKRRNEYGMLCLFVGMLMPLFVFAQGQRGISVTPLTFELTAGPGETVSNKLRVTNPTTASVIFEMDVEDFTSAGEGGEVVVENISDDSYSMRKWIATDPKRFTLEPGLTQIVDFTITVPKGAEPGGHYGTILATIKGTANVTGAAIAQKVGSLVLLTVAGPIREELFIREFTVPAFSEQGPIPFTMRFENTGSVHVRPLGFVTIANFWGQKVTDLPISPKRVLPGGTRKVSIAWDRKYPLGKYTATLVGSFGISNTPISAVTTFWVFPWKIALEIIGALIVVVALLLKSRRRVGRALRILLKGEEVAH